MSPTISGFVFSGGQSSRFGSNKLLHHMDGVAMGRVVLNNLTASFDGESSYVGPRVDHGDFVNISSICGAREGNGPLGAMCDVLEIATTDLVVFAPCDTPFFAVADFKRLIDTAGTHDVVVAADEQHPHLRHWLLSCWNVEATRDHMLSAYASGERAIHRAVLGLNVFDQQFPSDVLTNVNTPLDAQ